MRTLFFLCTLIALYACNSGGMLDQPFDPQTYDEDLLFMLEKDQASQEEVFLMVYAIIRQREYFNYEIAGKTYREILEMARTYRRDGLPVETVFDWNGAQEYIETQVENEGAAFVRKSANSSRLEKKFKFAAEYTNTSDKDVILLSSTFLLSGPFQDHLTSLAYQVNCLLKAGQSKRINYIAEATNIRDNMLHGGNFDMRLLSVDSLLNNLDIAVGGVSVSKDVRFFDDCRFGGARVDPVRHYDYRKDFDPQTQVERDASGKAIAVRLGETHYRVSESDDVLRMQ